MKKSRLALFLGGTLLLSALPALAADAPSLRIVTTGHPNPVAYRKNIEIALHACQLRLGLPLSTAGLPSEGELADFKVQVSERLLDGPLAASYETTSELMPDPGQGCRLRVAHYFHVEIDRSCAWRLYGGSGLLGPDGPGSPSPLTEERSEVSDCKPMATARPRSAAAQDKAPRQDAGLGRRCIWNSHVLALMMGEAPADPGEGGCLLAEMPVYPYSSWQGDRRSVALFHHLNDTTLAGNRFSEIFGAAAGATDARLTAFDKGLRIPAERFQRAGAKAFLEQPRWTELGDAR